MKGVKGGVAPPARLPGLRTRWAPEGMEAFGGLGASCGRKLPRGRRLEETWRVARKGHLRVDRSGPRKGQKALEGSFVLRREGRRRGREDELEGEDRGTRALAWGWQE